MKYHEPLLVRMRYAAQACAAVATGMGVLSLGAGFFGPSSPAPPGDIMLGMAPATALSFVVVGAGLAVFCTMLRWRYHAAAAAGSAVGLVGLARLAEYAVAGDWNAVGWLGAETTGPASLFSAVNLFLAGAGLFLLGCSARSRGLNSIAGSAGVVVGFVGLAFCLGYVYGRPISLGREVAPMRLPAALSFVALGAGISLAAAVREVGERRLMRRCQRVQHQVTRILAGQEDPVRAVQEILQVVALEMRWDYAGVWRMDPETRLQVCAQVWHAPGDALELFESVSRELSLGGGNGLAGKVQLSRQPLWVGDVLESDSFVRAAAALEANLHGAFCGPILVGDDYFGSLELFSHEHLEPDEEIMSALHDIGVQLAQYLKRKEAEQALREREERTRLIIETANDAFIETDAGGIITAWNRQAESMFGWPSSDALGRNLAETVIPARQRREGSGLAPLPGTRESLLLNRQIEMTAVRRGGETFPVEVTMWSLECSGAVRYNLFIRDITERKRAEEEIAARNAEIQQELEIAREFQEALLPHEYPIVPDLTTSDPLELHFHHVYKPAFSVGGDFFDVIKLSEHRAGVFIADVMGHGARSALITAILRTLLQDLARETDDPGRFLEMLNVHYMDIVERSHQFVFASAFYLIVDTEKAVASYASAGHPSPMVADRDAGTVTTLIDYGNNGPALGFVPDATYASFRRPVKRDDLFVLFTDGIVEASNRSYEEFGFERFGGVIRDNLHLPLGDFVRNTVEAVYQYSGSTVLSDDLCLVAVEVSPRVPLTPPAVAEQAVRHSNRIS